jgi:hypothetical protein
MTTQTVPSPRLEDERVVALLKAHVPLSLLMDLAQPDPRSHELYEAERSTVTPS